MIVLCTNKIRALLSHIQTTRKQNRKRISFRFEGLCWILPVADVVSRAFLSITTLSMFKILGGWWIRCFSSAIHLSTSMFWRFAFYFLTRKQSSKMRTARLPTVHVSMATTRYLVGSSREQVWKGLQWWQPDVSGGRRMGLPPPVPRYGTCDTHPPPIWDLGYPPPAIPPEQNHKTPVKIFPSRPGGKNV